ncbi:ATP-binding protein [Butyrivibrio sp. INlla16]|uniref:ATP-binding protein n=1 Tax=Butyrivibrio sp. INlla16 TaxID=1520807 RepID=UPI000883C829|nr:ATP-binding protein [Butyrivibrio sp. INlla16]SDB13819.1 DNA helicase HerA, contains HAS-barrel and ATPase domains [Butyrivibrio sp. INlla16]
MNSNVQEVLDTNKMMSSLDLAKDVITKDYLYKLGEYEVAEIPAELAEINIADWVRIFKFTKMVSDKNENNIDKMVTVLNAAYSIGATVVTLIVGKKNITEYYLGVVSKDISQEKYTIESQGETIKGVLEGNFPGLTIQNIKGKEKNKVLNSMTSFDYITAISGIASIRKEKESSYQKYVQGIEHLVDSLAGKEYRITIIADPVNERDLDQTKMGYESLYSQIAPFAQTTLSFNENETITVTQAQTDGISETIGESTALTQNYTKTSGWSESSTKGSGKTVDKSRIVGTAIGTGIGILATVATGGAAAPLIAVGAWAGGKLGSGLVTTNKNESETSTEMGNTAEGVSKAKTKNTSTTTNASSTTSEAEAQSHGRTIQITNENKIVKELLDRIDKNVERLHRCEAYGAFNCATYVVSSDPSTNALVASGFSALMKGDTSALQASYINNWSCKDKNGLEIKKYLSKLTHPLFVNPINSSVLLSPASLENSYELAVNLAFPKKSINGLPVFEMASFGRNLPSASISQDLKIGSLMHMGSEQGTEVRLNLKSLTMHTFITGSTGAGKSNTIYQMLRELRNKKVSFLVVEPAKGEYKHALADLGVHVYGTNPNKSDLLRINPFRFPEGIHVLEHIDRLVELFNVCWPMYAAMPAVLKDSVERAYIKAGWNLSSSKNTVSDKLFPSFIDVLEELNNVIGESAFSQEVKDNYVGSLATRIKSLTNGIYGELFTNDEIGDDVLFDSDVIVDLSRVGSIETKSMIMGIIIMRLQEYRLSSGDMNSDLKHVTVLEEAHNLLKRTSTEQNSESSNLLGKSVEMLANAIAEVRTYGEGFIIADQSPGLLDMSVIRNTNTKIIMRLPDAEDRNLVGKAANLNENQINELAKMPTGVAAIYQNDWLEPVLCKVDYTENDNYFVYKQENFNNSDSLRIKLIRRLLAKTAGERMDLNLSQAINEVIMSPLKSKTKIEAISALSRNGKAEKSEISSVIYDIICTEQMEKEAEGVDSIDEWKAVFVSANDSMIELLDENEQNQVLECVLREQIERYGRPQEYLETWNKYLRGEVY